MLFAISNLLSPPEGLEERSGGDFEADVLPSPEWVLAFTSF